MSEEKKEKVQTDTNKTDKDTIYCIKCGSKNKLNATYCSKCGAKIEVSKESMEDSAMKVGESVGKVAKKGWGVVAAAGKGFMNGIKEKEETQENPAKEENT